MMQRNETPVAVELPPLSSSSSPPPILSMSLSHCSHHLPLFQYLLVTLLLFCLASITSALSAPSGIAKFDSCANDTFACLTASNDDGRYNYTVGYCCCYQTWSSCKRALGCDFNGGGGNLAAPSASNHPKKVKGSAESCSYLKNQEVKMRKEKICPVDLSDCPWSGAPLIIATHWTSIGASLLASLLVLGRFY